MRKYIFVFIITIFSACNLLTKDKVESYVESSYSKCNEKCQVDFNSIFDYDKLYIFGVGVTNEEVSKTIGFQYKGDKDISRLILFVKNNNIIYEQNLIFDDSKPYKLMFVTDKTFFTNKIKFSIEKDEDIFILKPIEIINIQ